MDGRLHSWLAATEALLMAHGFTVELLAESSLHRFICSERVVGIACVNETGVAAVA
jgi:hypothetical protein